MPNPRKPTALKLVQGTFRKDRAAKNEPVPPLEMPLPPADFTGPALEKWQEITPILFDLGLLTRIDRGMLVLYCEEYARYIEAQDTLKREGMFITTDKGNVIQHPAVGIVHKAIALMHKMLVEFGMTPAARTKVSAAKKPDEADPFAEFK